MATELLKYNTQLNLWDKEQLVVILSRTKIGRHTTLFGDKNETLKALKEILLSRTK